MVSVVLVDDERVLSRRDHEANNAHGEVLAALIDAVLREAEIAPADLSVVGVGLGPGPFTGLRVGIVTAAATGDALRIPVYGACSLDAVGVDDAVRGQPFAAVTDARRRQVYWAAYDDAGDRIDGPDLAPPTDLASRLRGHVRTVVGPRATQYAEVFAGLEVADTRWPDAQWLAIDALRQRVSGVVPEPLTPMYLRRPDAREPGPPKRVSPA